MAKEEVLFRLSMLEQQSQELKQQIEAVNSQVNEFEDLKLSLNKLKGKKGKEMLAPLGRGIFLNTLIEDEKVLVNVGSRILVKKTLSEAEDIINNQIKEMINIKEQMLENMQALNQELEKLVSDIRE